MATIYPIAIDNLNSLPDVGTGLDQPLLLSNQLLRAAIVAIENEIGIPPNAINSPTIISQLNTLNTHLTTLSANLAALTTLVNAIITLNNLKTS